MSADNVAPIRGGSPTEPPGCLKPPRARKKCSRFHLAQSEDGPGNTRMIQALRGVCYVVERLAEQNDQNVSLELGTAAAILSEMLQDRLGPAHKRVRAHRAAPRGLSRAGLGRNASLTDPITNLWRPDAAPVGVARTLEPVVPRPGRLGAGGRAGSMRPRAAARLINSVIVELPRRWVLGNV